MQLSSNTEFSSPLLLPEFQNTYGSDGGVYSWGINCRKMLKSTMRDYFKTAITLTNSVALSGGTEKTKHIFQQLLLMLSIVPNNKYNRYNFTIRNSSQLWKDRLRIDASANYISQNNLNMINQGEYMNPLVSACYLMPRGYGLQNAKNFQALQRYNTYLRTSVGRLLQRFLMVLLQVTLQVTILCKILIG